MRRGSASIAANPVLIGAATTLVIIVAVFLAYNANSGLPFVPTYELKTEVPNAAQLVVGNDVRIGGTRVGAVTDITPVTAKDGSVSALLTLKLETSVKPLPVDSTVLIRPRSALGLKYVEITKGTSSQGYDDGATIPLRNATPTPVELDEVLNTFDDKTRAASQSNLTEFGNGLAGRGPDLNHAIEELNPLLVNLVPVMRNLSDPQTQLGRFVTALGRTARIVAPVAATQSELFTNLDTTFGALARVARPFLQDSISGGPPALDEGIKDFPQQRPFLANSEALFAELRPGVRRAARPPRRTWPTRSRSARPRCARSVAFNNSLKPAFEALERFAEDPLVTLGVNDLAEHGDDPVADDRPSGAGPDGVQLRDAVVPQRRQPAQRRRRQRHQPALHHHRHAAGAQQRGRPVVGARQRRRPGPEGQLPALQPVPEHRVARAAEGVRGRQRALHRRQAGDRQPARDPVRQDRDDEAPAVMLGRRHRSDDERVPRKDRMGANPVVVGAVVLVVMCIGVFFGFAKHVPFTHGFRVKAVFESSNSIRKNSPVRIAGVNVGKVVKVEGKPGSDAAVVTMDVTKKGLPIHKDATFKIRPRIFLEGNFFVDVTPGTPSAPTIDDGDTIPITQTATPVQLDQVLSALQSDTRTSLQKTLDGLRDGPELQALQGAGHRCRSQRARRERRPVAQRCDPLRRALAEGHRDRGRRVPRGPAPRPLAPRRRPEPHHRGPGAQRRRAAGPRHQLQHDDGRDGIAGHQPERLDPPARARRCRTPTARWTR